MWKSLRLAGLELRCIQRGQGNRHSEKLCSRILADAVSTRSCRGRLLIVVGLVIAGAFMTHPASAAPERPLIVTQVPRRAPTLPPASQQGGLVRADWFDGARLVLVDETNRITVLSQGFQSACDPNLSFDGKRLLFAGRKQAGEPWRIWEIGLDGQGLRPISPPGLEARQPVFATTLFTLDSPEPWFTAVFVGKDSTVTETGQAGGSSLYSVRLDGSDLRRLTWNPNHHFDPYQAWDGRLIYAAERHPPYPDRKGGRVSLYAIHVEGADMELYGGEAGRRIQQMPCLTPGGLLVMIESDEGRWYGAGQLACLRENRPHVSYQRLTDNPGMVFLYPSPLEANRVLVAGRQTGAEGEWAIYRFDADLRQQAELFNTADYHEVQALLVRPRPQPDGHSTVVNTATNTGAFYGLNCYDTDKRMTGHLSPGAVKRVRFIEGVIQPLPGPPAGCLPVPRRLVGEAPVEPDGSFNVEVPAGTPLLLQTLDERGLALATCGWVWVQPKETRGCIGCHEDPERIPENEYVMALRRPSNRLFLPPEQRRSITFRHDVAPLLAKHCALAGCHGGSETPLRLPDQEFPWSEESLRKAYQNLTGVTVSAGEKKSQDAPPGKYVDRGQARTSWLVWQLLGTNTSRPWDTPPVRSAKVTTMPPMDRAAPLNAEDKRVIIQWIDLGAQFDLPKPDLTKPKN